MAELEIEGTAPERIAIMATTLKQHHSILLGNGQPGLVDYVAQAKGMLRLIVFLLTLIMAICAVLAILEANRQAHTGILRLGNRNAVSATLDSTTGWPQK